jgi:hypothetical protein
MPYAAGRMAVRVGIAAALMGLQGLAHAAGAGESSSQADVHPMGVDWGLRVTGSVGAGGAEGGGGGPALQAAVEGEYWLSKYVGIGAKATQVVFGTLDVGGGPGNGERTSSGSVYALAPTLTVRASDATAFPVLSVALGYSWGSVTSNTYCDPAYVGTPFDTGCMSNYRASDSGLYGSVTAAWLFYPGGIALGPMVQLAGVNLASSVSGSTLTVGMELGFGYTSPRP